jgi:hypothetical protein
MTKGKKAIDPARDEKLSKALDGLENETYDSVLQGECNMMLVCVGQNHDAPRTSICKHGLLRRSLH